MAKLRQAKVLNRVLFVYDGRFKRTSDGAVHSAGGFPAASWARYLAFADQITVAARVGAATDVEGLTLSSAEDVSFLTLPSVSDPISVIRNRRAARAKLSSAVESVDLVICRLPSELGLLAHRIAKAHCKPVAVELVGSPFDALWHHGSPALKLYAPWFDMRVRRAVAKSDACLYVTQRFLQNKFPCSGIIGYASNVQINVADWSEINGAARAKASSNKLSVGLIGSMVTNYKGVDVAVRAISAVRKRGWEVTLRVLGPGDSSRYRSLADALGVGESIHFDGVLPAGPQVCEWLDELDVYIQPSRTEGLPRALIEAMARGLVCFGSSVGGIPELLGEEGTFPTGDFRKLADLIESAGQMSRESYDRRARQLHHSASRYDKHISDARRDEFWRSVAQAVVVG